MSVFTNLLLLAESNGLRPPTHICTEPPLIIIAHRTSHLLPPHFPQVASAVHRHLRGSDQLAKNSPFGFSSHTLRQKNKERGTKPRSLFFGGEHGTRTHGALTPYSLSRRNSGLFTSLLQYRVVSRSPEFQRFYVFLVLRRTIEYRGLSGHFLYFVVKLWSKYYIQGQYLCVI